VPSGC